MSDRNVNVSSNDVGNDLPLHGVQLVEASAGTGKTYTITTLFVRLLIVRELEISQILVVTYTRAATAELQDRIRRRLLEALAAWSSDEAPSDTVLARLWQSRTPAQRKHDITRLKLALADYDRASISTIHGFCQRVLSDHAFESQAALAPELITNERPLLQQVVHDFWARHVYAAPRFLLDAIKPKTLLDNLHKLARDTVHQRQAAIEPAAPPANDLPTPDQFLVAKRALATAWRAQGEAALNTIAAWPGMNGNSYKPETIRTRWNAIIDGYLHSAAIQPPKELTKLQTAALRSGMKKGFEHKPPQLALSTEVDALVTASDALMAAVDAWKLNLRLRLIAETRADIDRHKRQQERIAFDDLLRMLRDALLGPHGKTLAATLRRTYPVALVDEFQDTDPVQYTAFRRIYADDTHDASHNTSNDSALYLIGDPKQAIYRFRGADVFAYMDAVAAVQKAGNAAWSLVANYRSDPSMIRAVNSVFGARKQPFLYDAINFAPAEPAPGARDRLRGGDAPNAALTVLYMEGDGDAAISRSEAERIASEQTALHIGHLLRSDQRIDDRKIEPRDIAVLCRTNKQAAKVQEALRALRIPTARDGDSSVFETSTADELERLLDAIAQPDESHKLRSALATSILGVSASDLLALEDENDAARWEHWVTRMRYWHELWLRRGLMPMLQRLLTQQAVHARMLAWIDGERRLTDLMHMAELLQREASEHHVGPLALVQWLRLLRDDDEARAELASEEAQIRLESDAHAVKLTTVHRSKGLEYPIVYCPFLWHSGGRNAVGEEALIFHAEQSADSLVIDVSGDKENPSKLLCAEEALSEELRLAYVALTRAKHRCVIAWGHIAKGDDSALGYLLGDAAAPRQRADKKTKKEGESARLRQRVQELSAASGDTIAWTPATLTAPAPYRANTATSSTLQARERKRLMTLGLRVTSFSRLVSQEAQLGREAEEGHDHDGRTASLDATLARDEGITEVNEIALADVPAGADVGLLVHDVLEHCDFARDRRDELRARMQLSAPRHGMHDHVTTLTSALSAALDTKLGHGALDFCLADLARTQRIAEMELTFPIRNGLTAHAIADAIHQHDPQLTHPSVPDRLRALGFFAFAGFLRGYIDLCFEHDGRFYVADYKTNHLGRDVADYAPEQLRVAMAEHHYDLQALIYSLALHRHLQLRLRDYDYERCFGGYVYLFVRGMAPNHPRGHGVLHARPSQALISRLSQLLEQGT